MILRGFHRIIDLFTIVTLMIGIFIINLTYSTSVVEGYTLSSHFIGIVASLITAIILIIVLTPLTYYTYTTINLFDDENKRFTLIYMNRFLTYSILTMLAYIVGTLWLFLTGHSTSYIGISSFKLYIYPSALFSLTLFMGIAGVFVFLFGVNEYGDLGLNHYKISILYLALLYIMTVNPYNNYGLEKIRLEYDIRSFTNLLIFVYVIGAIVYITSKLLKKLRRTEGRFSRFRYRLTIYGYLSIILSIFFGFLDSITGEVFTAWMILANLSVLASALLLYTGLLPPKFLANKFQQSNM